MMRCGIGRAAAVLRRHKGASPARCLLAQAVPLHSFLRLRPTLAADAPQIEVHERIASACRQRDVARHRFAVAHGVAAELIATGR